MIRFEKLSDFYTFSLGINILSQVEICKNLCHPLVVKKQMLENPGRCLHVGGKRVTRY